MSMTSVSERHRAEPKGLAELYERNAPGAVRLAYLMTADRELAQDIAQEAFVRVAGRVHHLRPRDRDRGKPVRRYQTDRDCRDLSAVRAPDDGLEPGRRRSGAGVPLEQRSELSVEVDHRSSPPIAVRRVCMPCEMRDLAAAPEQPIAEAICSSDRSS